MRYINNTIVKENEKNIAINGYELFVWDERKKKYDLFLWNEGNIAMSPENNTTCGIIST